MGLCQELASIYNVVVLTSSERQAQEWTGVGGQYFAGDGFVDGVKQLRAKKASGSLVVFAQRYDGVDLPDDACRILVIDGMPQGESLIDKADSQLAMSPGGVRNRTIFRIEQGMGRPVRSHADFAVILLVGQDLATYVGRKDVLSAMTNDTRNQLRLSVELANLAKKSNPAHPGQALRQIIDQCLTRDQGWKRYYTERVRNAAREDEKIDESRVMLASREREAHLMTASNLSVDAKKVFQEAINSISIEEEELGVLLQRLARIAYLSDQAEGLQIQQSAHQKCHSAAVPPAAPKRPSKPGGKTVAENFTQWFGSFAQSNAAVLEAKRIADSLSLDSKAKQVEEALRKLGEALGATSARPEEEFGVGPDNMWFWGGTLFVIEAKSGNQESLHKSDSGQLHDSCKWAVETYPEYQERLQPVIVAKVTKRDFDAHFPSGTKVLTQSGCDDLGRGLHQLCQKLAQEGPIFATANNIMAELPRFELLPQQFLSQHCKDLG